MASVASQLIEEVTAHAQRDSLEDPREICADVPTFRITYVSVLCNTRLSEQRVHTGVVHLETLKTLAVFRIKTVYKRF